MNVQAAGGAKGGAGGVPTLRARLLLEDTESLGKFFFLKTFYVCDFSKLTMRRVFVHWEKISEPSV
jgi:hypothetical protein